MIEQVFNEKLTPSRCMWCVLNNLPKFDEKPEFVLNLVEKWKELMENMDEEYEKMRRKGGRECISTIQPTSQTDLMLQNLQKEDIIEILYYPERILYLEFIKKRTKTIRY